MCIMFFKKKQPRKWEFGLKPEVNWHARVKSKYDLQIVCKIILTEILGITDVILNVFTNDTALKRFDTDDVKMQAILSRAGKTNMYTLHLRSDITDIIPIICHEMVHLSQYYRGDLSLKGTTFSWKGMEYNNINYWSRPWEIEARKEQYKIEKQLKKLYYETDSR